MSFIGDCTLGSVTLGIPTFGTATFGTCTFGAVGAVGTVADTPPAPTLADGRLTLGSGIFGTSTCGTFGTFMFGTSGTRLDIFSSNPKGILFPNISNGIIATPSSKKLNLPGFSNDNLSTATWFLSGDVLKFVCICPT